MPFGTYNGYQVMVENELNRRTAMLCETLQRWESSNKPFKLTKRVAVWWKQHKELDKMRSE